MPSLDERRRPRFKGEDTKPTSRRELMGWYAYGIGAEVFAVCGVGSFLPLTLEQLARERGVLWSDRSIPCVQHPAKSTPNPSNQFLRDTARRAASPGKDNDQCVVSLLGLDINTASFAMYTFSLAVLVQALTLVCFSAFADHGKNRKMLLLAFGATGAVASMLFILVVPQIYIVGSILVIVSITCLGSSFVVLNSFLPVIVANDPSVSANPQDDISLDHHSGTASPRISSTKAFETSAELHRATEISSRGVGLGYAAAVFVQCISISMLVGFSKLGWFKTSKTVPTRIILLIVGIWWLAFTVLTRAWLRDRPGPPLRHLGGNSGTGWRSYMALCKFAWTRLWKTIKLAAKLRQLTIFLAAWFLLSDAIATVSGTAILFAKTELHMATELIALMSITATCSGIAGAFLWPVVSRRFGLQPRHTIICCIVLFELIPIYGLLEYIPAIRRLGVIGLQQTWEIYPLAVIHGLVSGGLSSYCRSFYAVLIPVQHEAAFYALYAFTDKGSSVIGPAIVGRMVDATGQVRIGFAFLAVLIVLPIPLIWLVDPEAGRQDALSMGEALEMTAYSHVDTTSEYEDMGQSPIENEERDRLLVGRPQS
ncbi:hypothetical protein J1614_009928 [Plenodomus biglobosus]|nr:hypothetical protein J1614_009928 [Plenodomus biglobosus]